MHSLVELRITRELLTRRNDLFYTILQLLNHDTIRLYIIVWRETSKSRVWRGCFLRLRRGCFEIKETNIPYLICLHAIEYGITEIQNSAGDLQNQTVYNTLMEKMWCSPIKNRLDPDPNMI